MRRHTIPLGLAALVLAVAIGFASASSTARANTDSRSQGFSAVSSDFLPSRDGFRFRNQGPKPGDSALRRLTAGRCGGMAFGALDAYYSDAPLPAGDDLGRFLDDRSADSIAANSSRFALWTLWPDVSASPLISGVGELTRREELPRLAGELERGPVALGLVRARTLGTIGLNHQVVAYALERRDDTAVVHVYDPGQPGSNEVTLEFDITDPGGTIVEYNGDWVVAEWRGLFVEEYAPEPL